MLNPDQVEEFRQYRIDGNYRESYELLERDPGYFFMWLHDTEIVDFYIGLVNNGMGEEARGLYSLAREYRLEMLERRIHGAEAVLRIGGKKTLMDNF